MAYFSFLSKRCARLCPTILLITLLLLTVILCTAGVIVEQNADSTAQQMKIGIVGDTENTYLNMGLFALEHLDDSRKYVDFATMTKEEADQALSRGQLTGYVLIPDGFVDALLRREELPLQYVTKGGPSGLGSILVLKVARTAADLVEDTQRGIYGMQHYVQSNDKDDTQLWKKVDELSLIYTDLVLNRTQLATLRLVGHGDQVSFGGYYLCAAVTVLLLLWGISCYGLLRRKSLSLQKLMAASGKGRITPFFWEYSVFFLFTCAVMLLLCLIFPLVLPQSLWSGDSLSFFFSLFPAILAITAMEFAFYEWVPDGVGVLLGQFVVALFLGYISGCFYPVSFFPPVLQRIGSWLPMGAGMSVMRQSLTHSLSPLPVGICLGWSMLFLLGGLWARQKALRR